MLSSARDEAMLSSQRQCSRHDALPVHSALRLWPRAVRLALRASCAARRGRADPPAPPAVTWEEKLAWIVRLEDQRILRDPNPPPPAILRAGDAHAAGDRRAAAAVRSDPAARTIREARVRRRAALALGRVGLRRGRRAADAAARRRRVRGAADGGVRARPDRRRRRAAGAADGARRSEPDRAGARGRSARADRRPSRCRRRQRDGRRRTSRPARWPASSRRSDVPAGAAGRGGAARPLCARSARARTRRWPRRSSTRRASRCRAGGRWPMRCSGSTIRARAPALLALLEHARPVHRGVRRARARRHQGAAGRGRRSGRSSSSARGASGRRRSGRSRAGARSATRRRCRVADDDRRRSSGRPDAAARGDDRVGGAGDAPRAADLLLDLLSDPVAGVRGAALRALARVDPDTFIATLSGLEPDRDWTVRVAEAAALGTLPPSASQAAATTAARRTATSASSPRRSTALVAPQGPRASSRCCSSGCRPTTSPCARPRRAALGELKVDGGGAGAGRGLPASPRRQHLRRARAAILTALDTSSSPAAARPLLQEALRDQEWAVRVRAATLLEQQGVPPTPTRRSGRRRRPRRSTRPNGRRWSARSISPHAFIETDKGTHRDRAGGPGRAADGGQLHHAGAQGLLQRRGDPPRRARLRRAGRRSARRRRRRPGYTIRDEINQRPVSARHGRHGARLGGHRRQPVLHHAFAAAAPRRAATRCSATW